jgi:hypothetical protein
MAKLFRWTYAKIHAAEAPQLNPSCRASRAFLSRLYERRCQRAFSRAGRGGFAADYCWPSG